VAGIVHLIPADVPIMSNVSGAGSAFIVLVVAAVEATPGRCPTARTRALPQDRISTWPIEPGSSTRRRCIWT